jgi:hypothetical protein
MAGDVDEVPVLVPAPHRLDGARVRLGARDVLLGVRLAHRGAQVGRPQARDAPVALVGVGQLDAVALEHDALEQVPVVVQRGVDVQGDARHVRVR